MSKASPDTPQKNIPSTAQRRRFRIELRGPVDRGWLAAFDLISFTSSATVTVFEALADQSALRGILNRVWDLNLDLMSVVEIELPAIKNGEQ